MATLTGYKRDNDGLYIDKDPESTLQYTMDWTNWLATGETVSTSAFTVDAISGDSDALTITGESITDNKKCNVKLTGGTPGNIYTVRNTIVTSDSQTERKFFRIVCEARSF
jgi:hypothetical protein